MGFLLLEPSCCTLLQKYDANVFCCWGQGGDVRINTAGLPFHREWLFPVRGDMCTTIATFWRISWSTNRWPCCFTRWCLRRCLCSVEGPAVSELFLSLFSLSNTCLYFVLSSVSGYSISCALLRWDILVFTPGITCILHVYSVTSMDFSNLWLGIIFF